MSRKVFISFLGAGNYVSCVYKFKAELSRVVTYIQTATIEFFAKDYDEYLLFCTAEAYNKHFQKLQQECNVPLTQVMIKEGLSENEIWDIFQSVYEQLREEDEIVYDITHSFRSLPMLGMVLLQYAKFLKKINVKGIYYGAFEKLGAVKKVEEEIPKPKDRVAPLLDLTSFSILQDWATAGHSFVNLGNADMVSNIAREKIHPVAAHNKGVNKNINNLNQLSMDIEKIALDFRTNRGKEIIAAKEIIRSKETIEKLEGNLIKPLTPILEKLKSDISFFKKDDCNNIFHGVQWCIDKKLIQEGLTMLQEGIVTALCNKLKEDYKEKDIRDIISAYMNVWYKDEQEWKENLKTEKASKIINQIDEWDENKTICKLYGKITQVRNDINHGGYIEAKDGQTFIDALKNYFDEAKTILIPDAH